MAANGRNTARVKIPNAATVWSLTVPPYANDLFSLPLKASVCHNDQPPSTVFQSYPRPALRELVPAARKVISLGSPLVLGPHIDIPKEAGDQPRRNKRRYVAAA